MGAYVKLKTDHNLEVIIMDIQSFFEQAKTTLKLTQSTPLQSAY